MSPRRLPPLLVALLVACGTSGTPGTPPGGDLPAIEVVAPDVVPGEDAVDAVDARADIDTAAEVAPEASPDAPVLETVDETAGDLAADDARDAEPTDVEPADCPKAPTFTYACTMDDPASCPGGTCAVKLCLGPKLDPDRWASCSDGTCDPCENATDCPADCATSPDPKAPDLGDPATLTIWVHGFGMNAFGSLDKVVYGSERGCSQFLKFLNEYGENRPCADTPEGAASPIQLSAPEYYGGTPAPWLTPADIAEIDAFPYDTSAAAERYARVIAKFIKWKLASTGAKHVNLACHSMGCMLTRMVLERDLEGLVSDGRIARWFTFSGAIAGARIARLYDNPTVQQYANLLMMGQADFLILNPDFVIDNAAYYDHKSQQGNSPRYRHIFVQHMGGTLPQMNLPGVLKAFSFADVLNPDILPDDGVLFVDDMYFHSQAEGAQFVTKDGTPVASSLALANFDHQDMTYAAPVAMVGAAAFFHHRKVVITLDQVQLTKDPQWQNPANIELELEVRFPWVNATYGKDVLAHATRVSERTAPWWTQKEGETAHPGTLLWGGPVFDQMDAIHLDLKVVETRYYPTAKIFLVGFPTTLAEFHDDVALTDHDVTFTGPDAVATMKVRVYTLY